MNFAVIFEEFRYMGELLAAELLLTLPSMKRRSHFTIRCIVGCAFCMLFTLLYYFVKDFTKNSNSTPAIYTLYVVWYSVLVFLSAINIVFCFKLNMTEIIWIVILAYSMQHIEFILINESFLYGAAKGLIDNFAFYVMICIVSCAILYFVFYWIFIPLMKERDNLNILDNYKTRLIYFVLFALLMTVSYINQFNAVRDFAKFNYFSVVADLFNSGLVLVVQYVSLRMNRLNVEKATTAQLYGHAMKQYDAFKESVDYINVKCHDFKHQIARMRKEGQIDTESLNEFEKGISVYESFVKTGNDTLDIVLTDKYFICRANDIALSSMANAANLVKMSESDIYALFGNILDNAIEHAKKFEDKQKRFIRLSVKSIGNMILLQQENYFEGKLKLFDGLPVTTKDNKNYHGFGLKSIKLIVEKYGGKLEIQSGDNLFHLDIILSRILEKSSND